MLINVNRNRQFLCATMYLFSGENPIFEVQAILKVPAIVIRPDINELQELMVQAGKMMVGVSKGVGQWSGNKKTKVIQ